MTARVETVQHPIKEAGAWYRSCHKSNLNGLYHQGGSHSSYADGVNWYDWRRYDYSMKRADMKIRPVNF